MVEIITMVELARVGSQTTSLAVCLTNESEAWHIEETSLLPCTEEGHLTRRRVVGKDIESAKKGQICASAKKFTKVYTLCKLTKRKNSYSFFILHFAHPPLYRFAQIPASYPPKTPSLLHFGLRGLVLDYLGPQVGSQCKRHGDLWVTVAWGGMVE